MGGPFPRGEHAIITAIALLVTSLLICVGVHEAAHALAMRTHGIPISEAGLGLPFPPQAKFTVPRLPFKLVVSPWLLGAYVLPAKEHWDRLDNLPYRDRAWILNAGIVANLLLAEVLTGVGTLIQGRLLVAAICAVVSVATWLLRRQIAAYVLPGLAAPALAFLAYALAQTWADGHTGLGVTGLTQAAPHHGGIIAVLSWFAGISLALAVMNTVPLFGLDNGKVVGDILQRWLGAGAMATYRWGGLAVVAASVIGAVATDAWNILHHLFA